MDLNSFFAQNPRAALAFSGGADSAYLLWAGIQAGAQIRAYYVNTAFQPAFELNDAKRLAQELGADLQILELDILSDSTVAANPANRCYHCKKQIFGSILARAQADGYDVLLDGTNASDPESERPGMQALKELHVLSPLRLCGLSKDEIRRKSKEAGLFTWNKPAYACLATRIPAGTIITGKDLERTEICETALSAMGFRDFRIRLMGSSAKLQIREDQFPLLAERRKEILAILKEHYSNVYLDLEVRG